jgi:hypothetical protein
MMYIKICRDWERVTRLSGAWLMLEFGLKLYGAPLGWGLLAAGAVTSALG